MKATFSILSVLAAAALTAPTSAAAELQAATVHAWERYLGEVARRTAQRGANRQPFLWLDESPDRAARVKRGEIVIAPVIGSGTMSVPNGLIHHWIGAVFIPNGAIDALQSTIHDYDNYQRVYRPGVIGSRTLSDTGYTQEFTMTWQRHVLFVNAALEGRYRAYDVVLDAHRGYNVADAAEVRQIEAFGRPGEHVLPPDSGSGFLWRIHSIVRYEERDGGVYLELEALALTRDIPASLSWLVTPVINHLSINSLNATLRQTREAVASQRTITASAAKAGLEK